VLGLIVGSFLNVVIYRLPGILERDWEAQCRELLDLPLAPPAGAGRQPYGLVVPRSFCPACDYRIPAWQHIPVLSYLLLGGRCYACRSRIPLRYPLVELAGGAVAALAAWRFGFAGEALLAALFGWSLLCLAVIDLKHRLLPDVITLPLLWLGLAVNLGGVFAGLDAAVKGAIGGYLALWLLFHAFRLCTGKEGMGYGDFKLLAAIGAWLGWQSLPPVLFLASLLGALVGVALTLRNRSWDRKMPFGPFLALAGWVALFWGEGIRWTGM